MSSINPNNINGQYPVAGQDNDSQGFRDNFTNIINNFTFAYNEINDLQQNALLKNPLSGTSLSNDMNYAQLVKPKLLNVVETQNPIVGAVSGSKSISWLDGDFQKFTTGGDVVLGITNWPQNGTRAKLRLQITTGANVANITFPTIMSNVGIASIQGFVSGQQIRLDGSNVYQFELSSSDNGGTLHIQDVLRNYNVETSAVSLTITTINAGTVNAVTIGNAGATVTGTTGAFSGNVIGGLAQFAAINSTPIGNASASSASFTNINASQRIYANATIPASSATTGALVVAGGVGIGGNLHVGAGIQNTPIGNTTASTGAFSTLSATGTLSVNATIPASSATTGALVVAGGVGIGGNLHVGAGIQNTPIGNTTASTGAFSTLSATGTLSVAATTTLTGGISGNLVINDPIGGGSFGSNLTVKGTVEFKSQDQSNNASVNTSTKSLTLAPGGDQFVLININGNCSIGYNATITPGHQTTVHVKNSAGALAYVIVPNANTNTGNAFIGLATGITGTFVFTSYGTDAGNVFVTVSR